MVRPAAGESTVSFVTVEFEEIRELVVSEQDPRLLRQFDVVLGAAMVIGAGITGSGSLLALIGPKNELVKAGRELSARLLSRPTETRVERYARYAAAYQLAVYSSFFAVAEPLLINLASMIEGFDLANLELSVQRNAPRTRSDRDPWRAPLTPHPSWDLVDREADLEGVFDDFGHQLRVWAGAVVREAEAEVERASAERAGILRERIGLARRDIRDSRYLSQEALREYWGRVTALAEVSDGFRTWLGLRNATRVLNEVVDLRAEVRDQSDALRAMRADLDVGLRNLARAQVPSTDSNPAAEALRDLGIEYRRAVTRPVIDDAMAAESDALSLEFPTREAIYVPHACRVLLTQEKTPLEDPSTWAGLHLQRDTGEYVAHHLRSPYSYETPLLILGLPGAGKSLLTMMIAARLSGTDLKPVRVALRSVDPEMSPAAMVEAEIRRITTRAIDWHSYCEVLGGVAPLVMFDGFDELLATGGNRYGRFLADLAEFQQRELAMNRGFRALVTSRQALMDLVEVPTGTTCVQLEPFDDCRQRLWIDAWNALNLDVYDRAALPPLHVPKAPALAEMARLPLLLLLLAVYSTAGDGLTDDAELDRTQLYAELIQRFIERERMRVPRGDTSPEHFAFTRLQALHATALGMLNRKTLKVTEDELKADLEYSVSQRISLKPRELFRGFFFVHESRAAEGSVRPTVAYEFLHNTFGEFLLADVLLARLSEAMERSAAAKSLPPWWYAAVIHAPIYTRPEVLRMVRERSTHVAVAQAGDHSALQRFVDATLGQLLSDAELPGPLSKQECPYPASGTLERLANYSVNLVLLRLAVCPEPYRFTVATADGSSAAENWVRLRSLWDGWLDISGIDEVCDWWVDEEAVEIAARPGFHRRGFLHGLPVRW